MSVEKDRYRTDVVSLLIPSGDPSDELENKLNELDRASRKLVQIISIPHSQKVMVVSSSW